MFVNLNDVAAEELREKERILKSGDQTPGAPGVLAEDDEEETLTKVLVDQGGPLSGQA
jgi:hypothetical protein